MNPDKLFDYLDGKLSPADRAEVEEKLMSDPLLRQQFDIARNIHRSGRDSREVVMPIEDPAQVRRSGVLARRIATAAAALVLINVLAGLAVIAYKNKKSDNLGSREAEMRKQLAASLGAAAETAMPPPTFVAEEIEITAPRADWEHIAGRIIAGATAFGGSAARGLPDDNLMMVVADIPSKRDAEFRRVLTSAAAISPMPAIAPGQTGGLAAPDDANRRTIVQVRIAEAAQ